MGAVIREARPAVEDVLALADDFTLEMDGALLIVEGALLPTDAIVATEVVRGRDGPASAFFEAKFLSSFAAGVLDVIAGFEAITFDLSVLLVLEDMNDTSSVVSSLGEGRVTSCLSGPLIDLGIAFGDGLGLVERSRPMGTVVLAFSAVGLRAWGPKLDR